MYLSSGKKKKKETRFVSFDYRQLLSSITVSLYSYCILDDSTW